jgi:hypothetical protein
MQFCVDGANFLNIPVFINNNNFIHTTGIWDGVSHCAGHPPFLFCPYFSFQVVPYIPYSVLFSTDLTTHMRNKHIRNIHVSTSFTRARGHRGGSSCETKSQLTKGLPKEVGPESWESCCFFLPCVFYNSLSLSSLSLSLSVSLSLSLW